MSGENRSGWLFSLRVKLIATLFPLMLLSMLAAMLGLGSFLNEFFHRRAESESAQLGQAIEIALRRLMLRQPDLTLTDTLAGLEKTPEIRRVWIIDKTGRVAHAADPTAIGRVLDRTKDPICTTCHSGAAEPQSRTLFTQDAAGVSILRHVRPIANERACWGCHQSQARLNGILLLEQSTEGFRGALHTIQLRLGSTGAVTLLVLAILILVVSTVLVERPVRRLIIGVRRVGAGDLTARVPVSGRDELAELACSFNGMTEDLGRSLEEIRNKNAELSVVYCIVERLTKTINLEELKEIILQTLEDVFQADRVILLSNLAPTSRETLVKSRSVARFHRIMGAQDGAWELPLGFPADLAVSWATGKLQAPFVTLDRRMIAVPIQVGDRVLALLLMARQNPFGHAEINPNLLTALGSHVAVAFENARLYTLAITDDLTQLYSNRHFQSRLAESVTRSERGGEGFGLLMLDLDHFKGINDTWGHPAGDETLRQVAAAFLSNIRVGDSAYRYGGEEFAILLPGADADMAAAAAERVRQSIESLPIRVADEKSFGVTVSIGVAICPEDGCSLSDLVAAADTALYRAKREGRNRVLAASPRSRKPASS